MDDDRTQLIFYSDGSMKVKTKLLSWKFPKDKRREMEKMFWDNNFRRDVDVIYIHSKETKDE